MSCDPEVLKRMEELCVLFQERWGKPVDFIACPNTFSQETVVRILERTVDTGESLIVGYEKIRQDNGCDFVDGD